MGFDLDCMKTQTCPKCKTSISPSKQEECQNCGIIFSKYKKRRAKEYANALEKINNSGLDTAEPILNDFLQSYPETQSAVSKIINYISKIQDYIYENEFGKAKHLLDILKVKIKGLEDITSAEIENIEKQQKLIKRLEVLEKALKDGRFVEARLLLKKIRRDYQGHTALNYYQSRLNKAQEEISTNIGKEETLPVKRENDKNTAKCPKCGAVTIATVKQGYNAGDGCCGVILLGPLGLLCGAVGSNDLSNVCQKCGHEWNL